MFFLILLSISGTPEFSPNCINSNNIKLKQTVDITKFALVKQCSIIHQLFVFPYFDMSSQFSNITK